MTYSSNGTEEIKKPENGTRLVYWQEKKKATETYARQDSHQRLQTKDQSQKATDGKVIQEFSALWNEYRVFRTQNLCFKASFRTLYRENSHLIDVS